MTANMDGFNKIVSLGAKAAEIFGGGFTQRFQELKPGKNAPQVQTSEPGADRFVGRNLAQPIAPETDIKVGKDFASKAKQYLGKAHNRGREDFNFRTAA